MASCVPVSQSDHCPRKSRGAVTLAYMERVACLDSSVLSMVAGMKPGNKQELEGGLTESPAPRQSPLASSCAVPGP